MCILCGVFPFIKAYTQHEHRQYSVHWFSTLVISPLVDILTTDFTLNNMTSQSFAEIFYCLSLPYLAAFYNELKQAYIFTGASKRLNRPLSKISVKAIHSRPCQLPEQNYGSTSFVILQGFAWNASFDWIVIFGQLGLLSQRVKHSKWHRCR